jgi:hypothetical protein
MTQDKRGPRRKDARRGRKGTPGGTGRKATPPPDVDEIMDGLSYDREILIFAPTWPARDRDAEIHFTSGNLTTAQGVTTSDLDRLAAEIARWRAENGPLLPAAAAPVVITDDIALNMAAGVLSSMDLPAIASTLRELLPEAEGKVHGKPYQEPTGKWGGAS